MTAELLVEIKCDIGRKSRFFIPHLHLTSPLGGGGHCSNIAVRFCTEQTSQWNYEIVKQVWEYVYCFRHCTRAWQRDRRTHRHHHFIAVRTVSLHVNRCWLLCRCVVCFSECYMRYCHHFSVCPSVTHVNCPWTEDFLHNLFTPRVIGQASGWF